MAIFWDDIEILRVLDECERGERSGIFGGRELMQAIAAQREVALTEQDYHGFVRELLAMRDGGLITDLYSRFARMRNVEYDLAQT